VLISGMIVEGGTPAALLRAWLDHRFVMVTSPAIIAEFIDVAQRPHLRKYGLTDVRAEEMAFLLWARALVTPGARTIKVIEADPADDMFLVCALEGEAEYIVSGDAHLLNLQHFKRVQIVTAAEMLRLIEEQTGE
jgi:putative PIN family toxin of toxin-antitoxin system